MAAIHFTGNLTADPRVHVFDNGDVVVNMDVAENRRIRQDDGTWIDGPTTFHRVNLRGAQAENFGNSGIGKGQNVVVIGNQVSRAFEHEGESRTALEVHASIVAPTLRYNTVEVKPGKGAGNDDAAE